MKFYKWIISIEVASIWVADGFDLDDERAQSILAHHLSYAHGTEIRARVLDAPPPEDIAQEQGAGVTPRELLIEEVKASIARFEQAEPREGHEFALTLEDLVKREAEKTS